MKMKRIIIFIKCKKSYSLRSGEVNFFTEIFYGTVILILRDINSIVRRRVANFLLKRWIKTDPGTVTPETI